MGGLRRISNMMAWAVTLVCAVGCHRGFAGGVTQPNPLVSPNETLRESEPITIVTGDMDLYVPRNSSQQQEGSVATNERYPLVNRASFTVVSRDRLRFHVQLEHKWQEYAELGNWTAWIVDDKGHRYRAEAVEGGDAKHVVSMWDREVRSVTRNRFGDITSIANDGYKRRQTLGSLSVFRGLGDYVFYARDIFTPDVKQLTLVVERSGLSFSFTWKFDEENHPAVGPSSRQMAAR